MHTLWCNCAVYAWRIKAELGLCFVMLYAITIILLKRFLHLQGKFLGDVGSHGLDTGFRCMSRRKELGLP